MKLLLPVRSSHYHGGFLLPVFPMEQLSSFVAFLDRELFTIYERTYTVGQVLFVPLLGLLGLYLVKRVEQGMVRRLNARASDQNLILFLRRLYLIVAYVMLALVLLSLLHIPLTAFAFVSGALAIGIGFGAKNILNNFISGWILMWERPIRIGDTIEIEGATGTVETINTRSTRIRRSDGVRLLVPNSQLLENTVVNSTLVDNLSRGLVRVGVDYASDARRVEALMYQAAHEHKDICTMPQPQVQFDEFGQGALYFNLLFWVDVGNGRDLGRVRSDLRFRLWELFKENGIALAFGATNVMIDGALGLRQQHNADAERSEV